jgi:hypothetical protein
MIVNKNHLCNVTFINVQSKVIISKGIISRVIICKVIKSKVIISEVIIIKVHGGIVILSIIIFKDNYVDVPSFSPSKYLDEMNKTIK